MARAVKCARQLMSVPGVGVRMMAYALQHGLTFEKTWPSGRRRRFAKPLYVASRQVEAQEFDVMVELLEQDGLIISFRDSGIGMTPDVVRDYFLRPEPRFAIVVAGNKNSPLATVLVRFAEVADLESEKSAGFLLGEVMDIMSCRSMVRIQHSTLLEPSALTRTALTAGTKL